jgi:hypothetical protein
MAGGVTLGDVNTAILALPMKRLDASLGPGAVEYQRPLVGAGRWNLAAS